MMTLAPSTVSTRSPDMKLNSAMSLCHSMARLVTGSVPNARAGVFGDEPCRAPCRMTSIRRGAVCVNRHTFLPKSCAEKSPAKLRRIFGFIASSYYDGFVARTSFEFQRPPAAGLYCRRQTGFSVHGQQRDPGGAQRHG